MHESIVWEDGYVRSNVRGEIDLASTQGGFSALLESMFERGVDRALIDVRQVTGALRTMDRFEFGESCSGAVAAFEARHPGSPSPRIAFVALQPILDPGRFAETVAVNRGMDCRMFDDEGTALSWLLAERLSK